MALIPPERLVDWTPGVRVGVIGGLDQYYPGGAEERTDLLNVKNAPYYAAGVNTETTGSITSGDNELTVADPTGWSFGNHLRVVLPAIHTFTILTGASTTGNITFEVPEAINNPQSAFIAVDSGETASQVAAKIRAATWRCWTTSGTGADIIFTQRDYIPINTAISVTGQGVTGSESVDQPGTEAVASTTTVVSVVGNVITLSSNATATVAGAMVQHDDAPSIQAAIDAYTLDGNQGVYLPSGEYRIYAALNTSNLGYLLNGRTLRGELNPDGSWATKIDQRVANALTMGTGAGLGPPAVTPISVASGLAQGSTSVVLDGADLGDLAPGKLMVIFVERDDTVPQVSVSGYNIYVNTDASPVKQMVRILTLNAGTNTVTFFPPLLDDYGGGSLDTLISRVVFPASLQGLEDIEIDSEHYYPGAYSNVKMGGCWGCWIRNCKITGGGNYPIDFTYNLNCEIRHSIITGVSNAGTNGAGILFDGHSCLIEDNTIRDMFPVIEVNGGSSGNAILYNYDGSGGTGGMWNINHAPWNQYNLYEGNCVGFFMDDGYFGGSRYQTIFRNYLFGVGGMNFKRFSRDMTIIGNFQYGETFPAVAGYPNIGNGAKDGEAEFSTGDVWRDWKRTWELTARSDDNTGEITLTDVAGRLYEYQIIRLEWSPSVINSVTVTSVNVDGTVAQISTIVNGTDTGTLAPLNTVGIVWPGSYYVGLEPDGVTSIGSFQEQDLDVGNGMIVKGNYARFDEQIDHPTAPDPVPDSLAYSAEPSWWPAGFDWPPFDTTNPATQEEERLPAAYRFITGEDPDPEPGYGTLTCETLNVTTLTLG